VSARTPEDTRKAEAFRAAVAWVAVEYGPTGVVEAFGNAEAIDTAWELADVAAFRAFLWERCKAARRAA
jgi:hypothetical protein